MAKPVVPKIDAESESEQPETSAEQVLITNRLLAAEAKARENDNREGDQRYWLRWGAVAVAVLLIGGMGYLLAHVSHHLLLKIPVVPSSFVIAMYVAPIASMTALSLALLVAAFRGFKPTDEAASASIMTEGARATGLLN